MHEIFGIVKNVVFTFFRSLSLKIQKINKKHVREDLGC